MTRTETIKILSVLKVAYPGFYSRVTAEDAKQTIAVWTDFFKNDPYQIVDAAVKAVINTGTKDGYPPDIGTIKEQIRRFMKPEKDTAMEAWHLVKKALVIYNPKEKFDALPELSQKVVGSPNQLREWALMSTEAINTVVQSNFLKAYRAKESAHLAQQALPEDVRKAIGEIQGRMMLGNDSDGTDTGKAEIESGIARLVAGANNHIVIQDE